MTKSLHRYTLLLAVLTLFLVVAGASVTSHEAGLSVPDWPLSYGQVMPEMTGGVFFEHGHRMVATLVGMLTIGLAIWLARVDKRAWMRKLGWIALGAVIVQGLLGGLTVKLLLPPSVSIAHACVAQLFFALIVSIVLFTSQQWQEGPEMVDDHSWLPIRTLAVIAPAVVLAQIALGAGFRHRAFGVMPHVVGSFVVAIYLLITAVLVLLEFPQHRALRTPAQALLAILFLQLMLGVAAFVARLDAAAHPLQMVLSTVAHVAGGGLTLAASVMLAIEVLRNVRVRSAVGVFENHPAVIS